MPDYTTHYKLKKPLQEEFYDIDDHNGNMDILDEQLKILSEASGVVISPDEPEKGDVWIDTDDESDEGGGGFENHASKHATTGIDPITPAMIGAAPTEHTHNQYLTATDISGKLDATKSAVESVLTGSVDTHTHDQYLTAEHLNGKVNKSGDTMEGKLIAQNNTEYGVKQVRNIFIVSEDETLPVGASGDLCFVYDN